jgi:hypothetical protein
MSQQAKAPGVKLIRPIKRIIASEDWEGGATLNIALRKDQVVSRYLVFVEVDTKAATSTLGPIRMLNSVTLIDADGNPIKSGHGFVHNYYNAFYNGRGVRPIGELNDCDGTAPQYGLLELRFELFDGDTRFLFPAFAMHDLQLQVVCEALATIDTHTTTTLVGDIHVIEEGYLKSSFQKSFLTRDVWHTILNRQKKHAFTSTGNDQRIDLWRGTHMRRVLIMFDGTANTFLHTNGTKAAIREVDRVKSFRNGTQITDEIPLFSYYRDVMDYGRALTAEPEEAALVIAGTSVDDRYTMWVNYDMAEGSLKSVLNLVGADSYEMAFDINTATHWVLLFSEEIV